MIALLSDFGGSDPYVGVMKGVIATLAPGVPMVDITHGVPPQEVRVGALFLDASWRFFPLGTVFLCVVDPGVGTQRRPVVVSAGGALFVGPDNGLFGLLPEPHFRQITADWGLPQRSATFHGRDLFAPVAARLAMGARFEDVGPTVSDPVALALPEPVRGVGEVVYVDHFGNAITNLPAQSAGSVTVRGRRFPVVTTYADVPIGAAMALTGSAGRLEIAVRQGSAAEIVGIGVGTPVAWRPEHA